MDSSSFEINQHGLPADVELLRLPESPSTNSVALAGPANRRRVIWTPRQTAGRGRGSNVWQANAGCLTFSYVEPAPEIPAEQLPTTSLIAALALADALRPLVPVRLKWPNDVYAKDRKLSGILVENHAENALVVGIGINLTNDVSAIDIPAINLLQAGAGQGEIDATRLVARWIQHFQDLLELRRNGDLRLAEAWRPLCWLSGKTVTMDSGVSGVCRGINSSGGLQLENDCIHVVHGGVVAEIR